MSEIIIKPAVYHLSTRDRRTFLSLRRCVEMCPVNNRTFLSHHGGVLLPINNRQ